MMKQFKVVLTAFAMLTLLSVTVTSQEVQKNTAEQPRIFAQKLLNETLARHPDVVIMAMHVTPPSKTDNEIIASNIGRYGKKADEDDQRVIDTGKSNLEVNKAGNHFEVECTLQDKRGKTIGAIGIVFNYKEGDDKKAMEKKALKIRDEMKARTPNKEKLFEPASW
jgi:hypothetical protein